MIKKLEFWGALGTIGYLLIIALTVILKLEDFQELKLNELGDFLAGVFGPVAFLWLVLGFLQQGRELKLSTDALRLQAEELKRSVEQQSIMATAAVQQIASQKAALQLQEKEVEKALSAVFSASIGVRQGVPEGIRTSVYFQNSGFEARDVSVTFEPPIGSTGSVSIGKLRRDSRSVDIDFVFPSSSEDRTGQCLINYLRSDGRRVCEDFTYSIPTDNPFVFIERRIVLVDD